MSDAESTAVTSPAVPGVPTRPEVPAWKLILTLAVAGVAAGLLLVFVNQITEPLIQENARRALSKAVQEVLKEPARVVSLAVEDGRLLREDETNYGVDSKELDRIFLGYDESDRPVGFAIAYEMAGFADQVRLIFGYDPRTKKVLGMRVLFSKETPGLGDKIEKDKAYVDGFDGVTAPIVPTKPGKVKPENRKPEQLDTITGATISSKKVMEIINTALAKVGPLLDQWVEEGAR